MSTPAGTDVVLYEANDGIATITLNRPDKRNALNSEVLSLMPRLMQQAEADAGHGCRRPGERHRRARAVPRAHEATHRGSEWRGHHGRI